MADSTSFEPAWPIVSLRYIVPESTALIFLRVPMNFSPRRCS